MRWHHYPAYFFGGAFLANALPHLVSGMTGHAFQSPFAHPPGEGLSPPWVNVLWGAFNLLVGYLLVWRVGTFELRRTGHVLLAGTGALAMALGLAFAFGRFYAGATGSPSRAEGASDGISLTVTLAHGSSTEASTRDQLLRLARERDLAAWLYTRTILVEDRAVPHSHPILTLNTRYIGNDDGLVSAFLHEEMHWYLDAHGDAAAAAVADLRAKFPPPIPVGNPDGATSEQSSYEHLLVNHFELAADRRLDGDARARAVFKAKDYYKALYRMVLEHDDTIAEIARAHELSPGGL